MWITQDLQRLVSRWFSRRIKSALEFSHCAAFPPPMPLTFLHVFGCCHALTQPDPKHLFKYTSYHLICHLLESLADFLGLELTTEMFELSVRKFSLSDDVLWRLLPVVPGSHTCRIQGSTTEMLTCLSCLWLSIPGLWSRQGRAPPWALPTRWSRTRPCRSRYWQKFYLKSSNLVDRGELLLQLFLLVLREVAQRHAQWWQGILRKKKVIEH